MKKMTSARGIRMAALLLAVIMAFFSVDVSVFADSVAATELLGEKDGQQKVIQAGFEDFGLTVTNVSKRDISYTDAVVNIDDPAKYFNIAVNPTGSVTLKPGEKSHITFRIAAKKNVKAKNYQYYITLKKDGETVYRSQYLEFTLAETTGTSQYAQYYDGAELYAGINPSDALYAGDNNVFSVDVYNASLNILRNCQVTVKLPEGVTIKNGSNTANVGYIDPLGTANCSFKVSVDPKAESGSKEFVVELKAAAKIKDGSGDDISYTDKDYSTSKTFYYLVNASEKKSDDPAGSETNPRLMVQNYSAGGSVAAGSTTNLTLTVKNTSKKNLYNTKVSVSGEGFVPVGSSNAYFIDKIGAGEVNTHTLTLRCDRNTEPGTKGLTVSMAYEDSKGSELSSEDTVSITVTQPSRLVIGDLTLPQEAYAGEEACVSLKFYNMGKNALANLMVSVTGDFGQLQNNSNFVGNMASGTDEDYECYIVPNEVGTVEGTIRIQYDNEDGNIVIEEVPFSFEATEYVDDFSDEPMPEEPEKKGVPKSIIIAAIVLVLLIIAAIVAKKILKKRNDKKLEIADAAFEAEHDSKKKEAAGESSETKEE